MPELTPLHPLFAARVTGLDLRRGVTAEEAAWLRAALDRHSVLVLPGQDITDAQQVAFSEAFGPLEATRPGARGAGSPLIVLSNIDRDGGIAPPTDRQVLNNLANRAWHHDSSFKPVPARASALSARETPSRGGETEFASMRAAWAALPEAMRARVRGRVAIHDFAWSRGRIAPALVTEAERAQHPPVRQAMLLEENSHGPALYLGAHARSVEGMPEAEGRALIESLMAHATQPGFVYRHAWTRHDIVVWDNRAVLHRATPFDSEGERRLMVRTTIAGAAATLAAA
ncbi:TauD/TfdA dioxygenase family protein [Paracraurococcus lichenis]|uniref:TauD/TfdA family dioxygenase n=1 Tax=Paracraurococcus lichenis TaxID=3064888 RepID=A0ABT9DY38_9PROT|nr:TauD/TfdA family dioxygenase [Paracraurococcus sp. LOR1-02]MDO9708819.1 TauD/TfdA family dioxygenase [Paracraurococcus sp. LOR1-02]